MTSTSSWGAPHPATGLHDDGGVRPAPADHRHRATLQQARDDYKAFFQDHPLGLPGAYDFYDPPIPVEIEGSLFFDMSHVTGGRPGPRDLRDDIPTIWEVHPITRIVFEP